MYSSPEALPGLQPMRRAQVSQWAVISALRSQVQPAATVRNARLQMSEAVESSSVGFSWAKRAACGAMAAANGHPGSVRSNGGGLAVVCIRSPWADVTELDVTELVQLWSE